MNDMAVENGAEFRRDLTKSVTHLVARNTDGEKYKFATQWNIKVVTVQWFYDTLERGMIVDEAKYHPLLPQEEQGVGAWIRPSPSGGQQAVKERVAAQGNLSDMPPRKKLRRTASTKLIGQNKNIWGDIIGAGYLNTVVAESGIQVEETVAPKPKSVIQVGKSFASETTFTETMESYQQQDSVPKQPEGFLDNSYFYVHGFNSKQVRAGATESLYGN